MGLALRRFVLRRPSEIMLTSIGARSGDPYVGVSVAMGTPLNDFAGSPVKSSGRHGTHEHDFPALESMPVRICLLDSCWTLVADLSLNI
jgi:hypothetical protein